MQEFLKIEEACSKATTQRENPAINPSGETHFSAAKQARIIAQLLKCETAGLSAPNGANQDLDTVRTLPHSFNPTIAKANPSQYVSSSSIKSKQISSGTKHLSYEVSPLIEKIQGGLAAPRRISNFLDQFSVGSKQAIIAEGNELEEENPEQLINPGRDLGRRDDSGTTTPEM